MRLLPVEQQTCSASSAGGFGLPLIAREASRAQVHARVTKATNALRRRPGGPELGRALGAPLLLRRPQLLACCRLLRGDRLRRLHEEVDGLTHRDVVAQRVLGALLAGALQRALELLVAGVRARRVAERLRDLLVRDLDPLR